jgi:hypothetical protein
MIKRHPICIKLPPRLIAWLAAHTDVKAGNSKSRLIEKALVLTYGLEIEKTSGHPPE